MAEKKVTSWGRFVVNILLTKYNQLGKVAKKVTRRVYQLGTVAFMKVMMRTCQHVGALIKPEQILYKYKSKFNISICILRCVSCVSWGIV